MQICQITGKCSFTATTNYFAVGCGWIRNSAIHYTTLGYSCTTIIQYLTTNSGGSIRYIRSRSSCNCRHDNLYCHERFFLTICSTLFIYSISTNVVSSTFLQICQITGKCSFIATTNYFAVGCGRIRSCAIDHTTLGYSCATIIGYSSINSC